MNSLINKKKATNLPFLVSGYGKSKAIGQLKHSGVDSCSDLAISKHLSAVLFLFFLGNFPLKTVGYGVLIAIAAGLGFRRFEFIKSLCFSSFSMVVLWLFLVASYIWSAVPSATISVISSQSVFILFSLFLAAVHLSTGISGSLKQASKVLLVLIVLYTAINPGYSISGFGLRSFYAQKNLLGAMMAVSALGFLFAVSRQKVDLIWAGVAIVLLVCSLSKTSIILFFVCALLTFLANSLGARKKTISHALTVRQLIGALFLVLIGIALLFLVVYSEEVIDFLWRKMTNELFTGRGRLWLVVIQQVRGDSLLGIGPGVLWQAGAASEIAQTTLYQKDAYWIQRMVSSDGSYIDLFASLGILGVALFLFTAVDLYRRLFKNWDQSDSKLIFALVTFVLLHGITESTILYSTNILWLIYLLCYFRVAGYERKDFIPVAGRKARPLVCW